MAMLTIEVEGDVEPVADAIGAIDAVIYVVVAAGPADLLVEVIAPDHDALYAVVNDQIRTLPGVRGLQTFTYYRTHTHRFTWGTR
jgi:Lrp/AsnC family transcriptional regulator for asnA, asnC and gidA